MASCHEVAYKLLVEWLPRELTIIETGNEGLQRPLIESYSIVTKPKAVFKNSYFETKC